MPGPSSKPAFLRHCVAKVAAEKGKDAAFAICTAQFQKTGDLKKGTAEPTAKGAEKARQHASEPGASAKDAEYERAIKRESISFRQLIGEAKKAYKVDAKVSPRHKWDAGYPVTRCERCGAHFSYKGMDSGGPYHCQPTPSWLKANPDDDGKTR